MIIKILQFYRKYCSDCKLADEVLEVYKDDLKYPVEVIECDELLGITRVFNIRKTPTFIVIATRKSGTYIHDRHEGLKSQMELAMFLDKYRQYKG